MLHGLGTVTLTPWMCRTHHQKLGDGAWPDGFVECEKSVFSRFWLHYRADPLRAKTCRCSRCATCTGRMRLDDGLSWAQDLNDAWFARATLAPRPFASCDPHNLNPSPTLIAPARHARHILAHTSSQTISHRDLSLGSSISLVYLADIAWS